MKKQFFIIYIFHTPKWTFENYRTCKSFCKYKFLNDLSSERKCKLSYSHDQYIQEICFKFFYIKVELKSVFEKKICKQDLPNNILINPFKINNYDNQNVKE